MKKIAVMTSTRAEYGLLSPVIHALMDTGKFDVRVAVTGTHLSPEFGATYKEIEQENINIHAKIDILPDSDTPRDISKSMGNAISRFADYFYEYRPDALLVLGDRYETLAVCLAAYNEKIPIIHMHGGEITEGATDNAFRHAISKLSILHFTSTEEYRRRVIQLGEEPDRVHNVGAIGVENVIKKNLLSKSELEKDLGICLDRDYAVVTFHPVTLENNSAGRQCNELLSALDGFPDMKYIMTKANADANGRTINDSLKKYCSTHDNTFLFDSLGALRYLSAIKHARMVIGNSSSGIIEVPAFHIPTVNIGDRQRGRIKAGSVIDCEPDIDSIKDAINRANDENFRQYCVAVSNPYGNGDTSQKIVSIIDEFMRYEIDLKKKFYDMECIIK